jgi:hypothetical protein
MVGSHVSAGAIAITTLALLLVVVVATWLSGWYEERARRAAAAVRRGARLRPGFGAVHGTAQAIHGGTGRRLVSTTLTQVRFGTGAWRDAGRVTTGVPFAIARDDGEEIEVDPRDATVEGGATDIQAGAFSREIVSRVSIGDRIWATGILSRPEERGAGAYRSGVARRRLIAPRRAPVLLSRESPAPRWQALASAHKWGAYLAAVVGALIHALVFRKVDLAILFRDQASVAAHLASEGFFRGAGASNPLALAVVGTAWWARVTRARGPLRR